MWDLSTGTCEMSIEAHRESAVTQLTSTSLYIVSAGTDNRVCIWDKSGSGKLLRTVSHNHTLCSSLVSLLADVIVIPKESDLLLYDVSDGKIIKVISLDGGTTDDGRQNLVRNLCLVGRQTVACDFGSRLCLIQFPSLDHKYN